MLNLDYKILGEIATHFADRATKEAQIMEDCLHASITFNIQKRRSMKQAMRNAETTADVCVVFGMLCCLFRDCKTVEELYEKAEEFLQREVERKCTND